MSERRHVFRIPLRWRQNSGSGEPMWDYYYSIGHFSSNNNNNKIIGDPFRYTKEKEAKTFDWFVDGKWYISQRILICWRRTWNSSNNTWQFFSKQRRKIFKICTEKVPSARAWNLLMMVSSLLGREILFLSFYGEKKAWEHHTYFLEVRFGGKHDVCSAVIAWLK